MRCHGTAVSTQQNACSVKLGAPGVNDIFSRRGDGIMSWMPGLCALRLEDQEVGAGTPASTNKNVKTGKSYIVRH